MHGKKIFGDAIWSYLAFVVMAVSGVALNFALGITRGTEALGVFNQTMAFYVICSHLAVFGIHNAVLYFTSAYPINAHFIFRQALIPLVLSALIISALAFMISPVVADLLQSPPLAHSLRLSALALAFFAFNKVSLALLNARLEMKAYALGQSIRYILIFAVVLWICLNNLPLSYLGAAFLIAEAILSLYLVFRLLRLQIFRRNGSSKKLARLIFRFSYQSAGAGLLNEINLRVDILALGYFMSDQVVGIYSFAAIFVEGFYNVGLVIRNILNPYIVKAFKTNNFAPMAAFLKKLHPLNLILSITIFGSVYFLFDPIIVDAFNMSNFAEAKEVIFILFIFMSVYFLFIPFEEVVLVSGNPATHTFIYLGVIFFNVLFNLLLIPHFGMAGAAVSTGGALMIMLISVTVYCRTKLGVSLISGNKIY